MIKALFSHSVPGAEDRRASLVRKREAGNWQRRCWEHTIRDEQDYAVHMDYIHFNPVKHGIAPHPAEWPFSSFARCVRRGVYPGDWGIVGPGWADAGERLSVATSGLLATVGYLRWWASLSRRWAEAHPNLLITQNEADIPFDFRHLRYVRYLNNAEGRQALCNTLEMRLFTFLVNP